MNAALWGSLIGIALVDSLNPSLFLAQFYLLTTPQPIPRLLSYIAGILLVNFGGGVILLAGVQTLVTQLFSSINADVLRGGQLLLGIGCLSFGLWFKAAPRKGEQAKQPQSLHPLHTFGFGMIIMLNELTTALPYFIAIERIAQAQGGVIRDLIALLVYNAVFSAPLLGFVAFFVIFRQRFQAQLQRISQAIQLWTPRVIKYGAIIFGGVLSLNAALGLFAGGIG